MLNKMRFSSAHIKAFVKGIFVPFSLVLPILVLYIFNPNSFQSAWKGRFPYIFFLWLFFLELALVGGKLPVKLSLKKTPFSLQRKKIRSIIPKRLKLLTRNKRISFLLQRKIIYAVVMTAERFFVAALRMVPILVAAVAMAVPTAYAVATFPFGLNQEIVELGKWVGVPYEVYGGWFLQFSWPLSFEYLVFTVFFAASVLLTYGIKGLRRFSVSLFFLGAMGSFYMIDTFYPYGTLIALQRLVPLTASSAANVLNWMGYEARLFHFGLTRLMDNRTIEEVINIIWIRGEEQQLVFAINWPCAGVHSLLIYTFVILLFLKEAPFSLRREVVYAAVPKRLKFMAGSGRLSFLMQRKKTQAVVMAAEKLIVNALRMVPVLTIVVVGAVGTFIVNVLRIVSICIIGVNKGAEAAAGFHSYYGELYFIAWILLYLFAIIYGSKILTKLRKVRNRL